MPSGRYVEILSDDCICRACNYSDSGGWYITVVRDDCPDHERAWSNSVITQLEADGE